MSTIPVTYKKVSSPKTEIPLHRPELGAMVIDARLKRLRARMRTAGFDAVIIYADREHAANFAYLTDFVPRFEEALLLVMETGDPVMLLGNENLMMADLSPLRSIRVHFPALSLINQPRQDVGQLTSVLHRHGLSRGTMVGTVGWKYYGDQDGCPPGAIELPHWIVRAIADAVEGPDANEPGGRGSLVRNATRMFMSPQDGLRTELEADQIAQFEFSACLVASSMMSLLRCADFGCSELELASQLNSLGCPLSMHPQVSVGEKARYGLASPSGRRAVLGDFMTAAFGVAGALSCRAAYLAYDGNDLPADCRNWLECIAMRYFATAVSWYRSIGVGVSGGRIYSMVRSLFPPEEFGWYLNPGHYIAEEEWVSSPFYENSDLELRSGNYVQFDLIPSPKPPHFGANMEDGVVIADEFLRAELRERHPDVWARFERRRKYAAKEIGLELPIDVLPISDILGYYIPFLRRKDYALAVR